MRFKILGTAAAECVPAIFCTCDVCRQAAANGGKDVRRRAAYLLDDDTLIDYGPDIFAQSLAFGVDFLKIRRILISHRHVDHLNPVDLAWRRPGYSKVETPVEVIGSGMVFNRIMLVYSLLEGGMDLNDLKLNCVRTEHGKMIRSGDLEILPLEADHALGQEAQFYALRRGGKSILVANDTGWPPESSWEKILERKYDLVTMDCTMGLKYADSSRGHMGADCVLRFADRLRKAGVLNKDCRLVATHFSHNGDSLQSHLEAKMNPAGIEVAYDGMEIIL